MSITIGQWGFGSRGCSAPPRQLGRLQLPQLRTHKGGAGPSQPWARNRHPALRNKLWRLAESFQFGIGTLVFDEGLWTFSNRQVGQAHRFVLVAALQRQFATEEIDLADMSVLDAGIGIVRGR
jgi:hypothetical protein